MSKRLTQNLNSAYLEAANHLRPNNARRRIVAYVESYDDVAFWRGVLDDFETPELFFEVKLPGRDSLQKGKRQALSNVLSANQLGCAMIACVDADYDYLLQNTTAASHTFNSSPYVVHTVVYAIENYQCYAPSLHQSVVTATLNDRPIMDYEAFLREYSQIIWPLFLWNIWGYLHDDIKDFTMLDFCGFISFRDISPYHPELALASVRRRVNQKMAWMQQKHPEAKKSYAKVKQKMRDLGLTPDTTYLYIQGHTLFENVIMPLLEPICTMLRKEREREIKQLAVHNQQRQCELSAYQHAVMPIDQVLKKNTDFKSAPPFQLVRAAILRVIELNHTNTEQNETDTTPATSNSMSAHSTDTPAVPPLRERPNSI
ncbi:MAG: DUF4435 domain-containing protein [Bacteroidaceae bacterium]|nr:DUF4435 domain-containing protein [Bacteroidaceae bacterium]